MKFPESQWSRLPWQPGRVKCFKKFRSPKSLGSWRFFNPTVSFKKHGYPKQKVVPEWISARLVPQLLGGFLALAIISDPNDKNHPEKWQLCSQVGPSLCLGSWCQEPRCLQANQREWDHKSKNHMSFTRKKTKGRPWLEGSWRLFGCHEFQQQIVWSTRRTRSKNKLEMAPARCSTKVIRKFDVFVFMGTRGGWFSDLAALWLQWIFPCLCSFLLV